MEEKKRKPRKRIAKTTFAGKRSVKQRVWDYMRRNKLFKVKDMQSILDIKEHTIRAIIYPLEVAGYIQRRGADETKARKVLFEATFVFLAKENILTAPIINSKEVYCTTTGIKTDIAARKILLNALKVMSQGDVAKRLELSKTTINQVLHNKYPAPHLIYKKIRECL
ncbi:hypothetical protein [Arcobacter sp. L]|jgi:predicted transcriptional regulator|uniref:hypothetical protein n=1 Tax=Arcobacter sp. L TaxID=944547 RepID=UPI0002296476|nr:hypothetical protein [Arcobacter sp. L]BAK73726.1 hypothetical protein ABLL_1851 [Arcobacter sp. L]